MIAGEGGPTEDPSRLTVHPRAGGTGHTGTCGWTADTNHIAGEWLPDDDESVETRWPAGRGDLRRPLAPRPDRPNPTDPGNAADPGTPQGYPVDPTGHLRRADWREPIGAPGESNERLPVPRGNRMST